MVPPPEQGETGLGERLLHIAGRNSHLCPEALEKILETQESRARESLERGAAFLGTIGANAPFLGLTGTVLGILAAFRKMAESGGGGTDVMTAISGALIATAAGLLVAIPSVVLYNVLKARIKKTVNALGEIRNLLVARSLQATVGVPF
jgi:biopolymer transport protein ExbB